MSANRKPSSIALVLMGGGLLLTGCDSQECRDARREHRADADTVCQRGDSTGAHGGGGGYHARSGSGSDAPAAEASRGVARGGFGGWGAHFGFGG